MAQPLPTCVQIGASGVEDSLKDNDYPVIVTLKEGTPAVDSGLVRSCGAGGGRAGRAGRAAVGWE